MSNDILNAQDRLGRTLARAHAAEDRALAGQVREYGDRFVQLLLGLLRMSRIHSAENKAFDKPVEEVVNAMEALYGLLGAIRVVTVEDQVYVNDVRVGRNDQSSGAELCEEYKRHNVGGITFMAPLSRQQVRLFFAALASPAAPSQKRNSLARVLYNHGLHQVQFEGLYRFRRADDAAENAFDPEEFYKRACEQLAETYRNLVAGRQPNVLTLRRLATELISADLGCEGLFVEPAGQSAFCLHTIRVAHLSLLVGREIGLDEAELQDLGLSALFHDMGEALVPSSGPMPHETGGAIALLRQRGFHEAKTRRLLATIQHSREQSDRRIKPSLFARIIRIAEDYDLLVRRRRTPPAAALALLAPWANTRYDPALLQAFMNRMGQLPPGTFIELTDGRVVRSISLARDPQRFERPLTRVVRDASGKMLVEPALLDLAIEGQPKRVLGGAH